MKRDVAALVAAPHDVLVVGGGIYGVAAAHEAARRGLAVALVEAADFGGGASWNSLKTIHGGLRHLQRLDFGSHRESVRERRTLLRVAPALVRPLPFLVPAYGHGPRGREVLAAGLVLNDLLSFDRNRGLPGAQRLPRARMLSRTDTLARVPGLRADGLAGGALFYDAQIDSSERLTIAYLCSATSSGAQAANHCEVVALRREGARVTGARVRDRESGREHEVTARVVLNAAGSGAERLLEGAGLAPSLGPWLMAQNLVFDAKWPLAERIGVGARTSGRFLFLIPWRDRILAGTDYWPAREGRGPEGVSRFGDEVARAFPWAGLDVQRIALVHRGLVPGVGGAQGLATRPLVRDHEGADGLAGLVTVQGVKYTTARAVAERAVLLACQKLGRPDELRPPLEPLPGARLLEGPLAEQARVAVREEMARTLQDAVLRRIDLGTAGPAGVAEVAEVAGVMAQELDWDEGRLAAEKAALARFYEAAYNGS